METIIVRRSTEQDKKLNAVNDDYLQKQHQRQSELMLTAIQGHSQSISKIRQGLHVSRDATESYLNASKAARQTGPNASHEVRPLSLNTPDGVRQYLNGGTQLPCISNKNTEDDVLSQHPSNLWFNDGHSEDQGGTIQENATLVNKKMRRLRL